MNQSGPRSLWLVARRSLFRLAVTAGCALSVAAPAGAASTLQTGFMDNSVMTSDDRDAWLAKATAVGASRVRIAFGWATVAPVQPPDAMARNPSWGGYDFSTVDPQVKAATSQGFSILLSVNGAPPWAEGPGKPSSIVAGAWKPDAKAFGAFMQAVARRYDGTHPDPASPGTMLPRVREFQLWNEPNLDLYLAPQYEKKKPFAPGRFRDLVNEGWSGVKAGQPSAKVVAAGLAPFGDPGANPRRIRPVAFLRSMLCLDRALKKTCAAKTNVDVLSLHPYAVDRPGRAALDRDDATVPDIGRLKKVVSRGLAVGSLGPRRPSMWVTEFSYDSSPPDPKGVKTSTRARWISESFWRFSRAGAEVVIWYLMRDQAPEPSYAATYQSGMFLRSGTVKPDARAFAFPLVVTSKSARRLKVWFRAPRNGAVQLQIRESGRWKTVRTKSGMKANGVATVEVRRGRSTAVRGVAGDTTSYPWKL